MKNFKEKPNNSLLLEKIAELTMHLESLLTEVEVFGKQRGPLQKKKWKEKNVKAW